MPKFSGSIHTKLPHVGTSIFAVMSQLAAEHNAINLAQGFPDFSCDPSMIDLVTEAMKKGHNQYAPMPGIFPLREVIAEKTEFLYSAKYDPNTEVTITAGATQALFTAISAILREGDEVIIFEPAYDSYLPAIDLTGAKPVFVPLKFPDYAIDWEFVKKLVNQRTRMIIINTPNNPTGTIFSASDLSKLEKLVRNTDIVILSDEVYEHIIFDGYEHQSVARYPKLAERSFIISSFGKTYHTTGWKMGYVLAPKELMAEFRKVHQFLVFSVNTPIQYAMAEMIKNKDLYLNLSAFYQEKRDFFLNAINGCAFEPLPASGTYFQLLKYNNISKEKDVDFAKRLTIENKLASIPISVFYHRPEDNKVLRFCFAKSDETLKRAADVICSIKSK